jgi:hypothetical protein
MRMPFDAPPCRGWAFGELNEKCRSFGSRLNSSLRPTAGAKICGCVAQDDRVWLGWEGWKCRQRPSADALRRFCGWAFGELNEKCRSFGSRLSYSLRQKGAQRNSDASLRMTGVSVGVVEMQAGTEMRMPFDVSAVGPSVSAQEMQVLRLAAESLFAPKAGAKKLGCIAQDDKGFRLGWEWWKCRSFGSRLNSSLRPKAGAKKRGCFARDDRGLVGGPPLRP